MECSVQHPSELRMHTRSHTHTHIHVHVVSLKSCSKFMWQWVNTTYHFSIFHKMRHIHYHYYHHYSLSRLSCCFFVCFAAVCIFFLTPYLFYLFLFVSLRQKCWDIFFFEQLYLCAIFNSICVIIVFVMLNLISLQSIFPDCFLSEISLLLGCFFNKLIFLFVSFLYFIVIMIFHINLISACFFFQFRICHYIVGHINWAQW